MRSVIHRLGVQCPFFWAALELGWPGLAWLLGHDMGEGGRPLCPAAAVASSRCLRAGPQHSLLWVQSLHSPTCEPVGGCFLGSPSCSGEAEVQIQPQSAGHWGRSLLTPESATPSGPWQLCLVTAGLRLKQGSLPGCNLLSGGDLELGLLVKWN